MHIPDGMLPFGISAAGYAIAGAATWYSLYKINQKENPMAQIPKVSLLTAALFTASLIKIPIPPASVHVTLIGLLGALLGPYSLPAILIALFFQAVMFQQGGLTTLGVNATIMGLPAILSYYLFSGSKAFSRGKNSFKIGLMGFLVGILGVGFAVLLFYLTIINFLPAEIDIATEQAALYTLVIAHLPLILLEGIFSAFILVYLNRVKPEILED